ncbi:hypothetical protein PNOK_0470200 [Pyrrhoderma noxium]|uniref:Uncharacterized protein n=1 Tax=Pyrrhoderma noxium TaxID=2282107 RepID=A0A286UJN5_9AGAM|nr:hypothetical protein PNOK_0470200 [Pyrrhoderma noxium]
MGWSAIGFTGCIVKLYVGLKLCLFVVKHTVLRPQIRILSEIYLIRKNTTLRVTFQITTYSGLDEWKHALFGCRSDEL